MDKDTPRSLVIIYGFFFVLLSALLNLAYNVSVLTGVSIYIYVVAWIMSLSSALIGGSIYFQLRNIDLMTRYGLLLMAYAVPAAYLILVSELLGLHDWIYWGQLLWLIFLIPPVSYGFWKNRKFNKRFEVQT